MQRGGNYDAHGVVRHCNTQMDYGYQNPQLQHINPQSRYPPLPNPNHQYVYQNQPSSSYSCQNDHIIQNQFPNSLNVRTDETEAPHVIYDHYFRSIPTHGKERPFLEDISPKLHQEQPQVLNSGCERYTQDFKATSKSKLRYQGTIYNDPEPETINLRAEPQTRYQYQPEIRRTLQFLPEKEPSLTSRPCLEEFLPMEQGIKTPIPVHATPESMEEFESENLKPGPSETYKYLPGTRCNLSSAFKPYSRSREREPTNQSGCREMFHSRQYSDKQTDERNNPFDKRLFNNPYHTNTANRDRFIIPIKDNSEFENQDKRRSISNRVQVIMDDVENSELNSYTHKPLETLETAEGNKNMDKIMNAKRVAHKFDDASKQIIIPAPSKIKVRTQRGHKHHKTSQLAGMLNHVAAGASTFDGNSYLVQSMVGGVGGMNPMHTAYQQQYFYSPIVQPENQYIPQYVTYNQTMPIIPSYIPENGYGGTYFQLTGTNNASYDPANVYLQQTYSESDNSVQSSQEDHEIHELRSVTNVSRNKDDIQVESMPEKISDMPAFDEHDPLGLTRDVSHNDTMQPKPFMKAEAQQPSKTPFPEQLGGMSVNGTQDSIKRFDRMSNNGIYVQPDLASTVNTEDDFEDFLLGTATASSWEMGTHKSERQQERDPFDLDVLFEDDYYKHSISQHNSSDYEKSEGSNFPNSQKTTQLDNQNTLKKSVKERENPNNSTSEDKYDDFISDLLGEHTDAETGTAEKMSNPKQSGKSIHTPSVGNLQDVKPLLLCKEEKDPSPVLSNSGAASEDFYSELLEDLMGDPEKDKAAVDLSSNCDSLVHFDEPPIHSLQDLVKDMGSSVSSILSDILSTSHGKKI